MAPSALVFPPPHPPVYFAKRLPPNHDKPEIDGNILDKKIWTQVPFSDPFDEIRGPLDAPTSDTPNHHRCRTRMKMLWDDEYLYVGALLEYGLSGKDEDQSDLEISLLSSQNDGNVNNNDALVSEIIATFTERNSPIFHQDSDFEVFIDADSSCQFYKELEMNAINTVWNLMLNKPYADGGVEHSARIAKNPNDKLYYEVEHQKSAAKVVHGSIKQNDDDDEMNRSSMNRSYSAWTVEIALAHKDTLRFTTSKSRNPSVGDFWRINFSRVEWKGQINWTWVPQIAWDPKQQKWKGFVDMHRPDAWGYVYFADEMGQDDHSTEEKWTDPYWPEKSLAMVLYYELHSYKDKHGSFTDDISKLGAAEQLLEYDSAGHVYKFDVDITLTKDKDGDGFIVKVRDQNRKLGDSRQSASVYITDYRKVSVEHETVSKSS